MKPKIHYHVHKSSTTDYIPSQINSVHAPPPVLFEVYYNIVLPSTPVSLKWLLSLGFMNQNFVSISDIFHVLHASATHSCVDHPKYVYFSSLPFLHSSYVKIFSLVSSSPVTSICVLSLVWELKFLTYTKQRIRLYFSMYTLSFTFLSSTPEDDGPG